MILVLFNLFGIHHGKLMLFLVTLYSGIQHVRIPRTTIDVIVPRALIPVIRGEDDGCLKEICQVKF